MAGQRQPRWHFQRDLAVRDVVPLRDLWQDQDAHGCGYDRTRAMGCQPQDHSEDDPSTTNSNSNVRKLNWNRERSGGGMAG